MRVYRPTSALLSVCLIAFAWQFPAAASVGGEGGASASQEQLVQVPGCDAVTVLETQQWPEVGGAATAVSVNAPATLRRFQDPSGRSLGQQVLPPVGWSPLTATDGELAYYGMPARPASDPGLGQWEAEWSIWNPVAVTPCVSTSPVIPQSSNGNGWAGVEAYGHTNFNHVSGKVHVPNGSDGSCKAHNSNSAWVGLGGDNSLSLLQNGVIEADYVPNGARLSGEVGAFYEELDPAHPQSPPMFVMPGIIAPDDNVSFWIDWNSGTVEYGWHDLANGNEAVMDRAISSNYYDGSTAELIDEDQSVETAGMYDVRHYSSFHWWAAQATAGQTTQDIGAWSHHEFHSTGTSGTTTQDLNGGMTSNSEFYVDWWRCH